MTNEANGGIQSFPYHPEEMRATWDCKIGKSITLQGNARWTPAGVVTAGIAASVVLLSLASLVRAAHGRQVR